MTNEYGRIHTDGSRSGGQPIPSAMTNEERAALVERIAELEAEVERRTYNGIHSCHDQCQRVACVLERRIAELETALRDIATGRYSGVVLTSIPPKDAAVERARAALGETK